MISHVESEHENSREMNGKAAEGSCLPMFRLGEIKARESSPYDTVIARAR